MLVATVGENTLFCNNIITLLELSNMKLKALVNIVVDRIKKN